MARKNGKRDEYVGQGRFGDKGGKQIGSAFEYSTHNDKIKHIYGNYNFWSWFRYWYLDSCNLISMLLIDKGFFDYDYEKVEKEVKWEDTVKDEEQTANLLAIFGLGPKAKQNSEDALQDFIIKEEQKNGC